MLKQIYLLVLVIPFLSNAQQSDRFNTSILEWSRTMAEAIHVVNERYYEQDKDPKEAMIRAIDAFMKFDPHSAFLDPSMYKRLLETTNGQFGGIGVIIDNTKQPDDEALEIIEVIYEGPAEKTGLRDRDRILEIEGQPVKGMSVDEIITRLKGEAGTRVSLTVQRATNAELLRFVITRDMVKEQHTLCFYFQKQSIYYLSLTMFSEHSALQVEDLLKKALSQHKAKGLILDLRNNSGGLLNAVIDIVGLFVPKNSLVVVTKDRTQTVREEYKTTRSPLKNVSIPIIILVNNYTASAAEILAGCLRLYSDKGNGIPPVLIVGSTTYGKGTVQEVIPLSNDSAVKLTTAVYYFADGTTVQKVGIVPDIELQQRPLPSQDMLWFQHLFGKESSLKGSINPITQKPKTSGAAVSAKLSPDTAEKSWLDRKIEQLGSDYWTLCSIRMLQAIDLAKNSSRMKLNSRAGLIDFFQTYYTAAELVEPLPVK